MALSVSGLGLGTTAFDVMNCAHACVATFHRVKVAVLPSVFGNPLEQHTAFIRRRHLRSLPRTVFWATVACCGYGYHTATSHAPTSRWRSVWINLAWITEHTPDGRILIICAIPFSSR